MKKTYLPTITTLLMKTKTLKIKSLKTNQNPLKSSKLTASTSVVAILGLSLTTTIPAQAQNMPKDTQAPISVGVNVMFDNAAYDIDDAEVLVLPSLYYDNNKLFARGNQIGGYIVKDNENQVNVFVEPGGSSFDPDDADGALKGLDERERTAMVGASYTRLTPIGGFRLKAQTDVLGRSDGTTASLAYLARLDVDKWTVYPSIGVQWHNDTYNDYYYGVSQKESTKTGIVAYDAESSFNPYVNVNANYQINEQWAGFLGQKISYVADEQYDSPMVDNHTEYRTTLGVIYTF